MAQAASDFNLASSDDFKRYEQNLRIVRLLLQERSSSYFAEIQERNPPGYPEDENSLSRDEIAKRLKEVKLLARELWDEGRKLIVPRTDRELVTSVLESVHYIQDHFALTEREIDNAILADTDLSGRTTALPVFRP